jgi:acid phosphatase
MPSLYTVTSFIVAIIALIAGVGVFRETACTEFCSQTCSSDAGSTHTGYFQYECAGNKPHHASWSSWWHPQRSDGTAVEHKQGAGAITNDWNILYHLGGNGPWVEKVIDVVDGGIAIPEGCQVEQVHMVGHSPGMLRILDLYADVNHRQDV